MVFCLARPQSPTTFALAHQNANKSTRTAFINADWRDFQSTPAINEARNNSILVNDHIRILNQSGWEETHTGTPFFGAFSGKCGIRHAKEENSRRDQSVCDYGEKIRLRVEAGRL